MSSLVLLLMGIFPIFPEISPLVWFIALIGTLIIKSPFIRGFFFSIIGLVFRRIQDVSAPYEKSYQRSQTSKKQPRIRTRSPRAIARGDFQEEQMKAWQGTNGTPRTRAEVMENITEYMPEQTRKMIENKIPEEIMKADDPNLKKLSKKMRIPEDVFRAVIEGKKKRDLEESEV